MKTLVFILLAAVVFSSCARRSVTPYQAANNNYKNCRNVR
jgi:hypothetical protein